MSPSQKYKYQDSSRGGQNPFELIDIDTLLQVANQITKKELQPEISNGYYKKAKEQGSREDLKCSQI